MVGSFDRVRVIDSALEQTRLNIVEGKGVARAVLWSPDITRFRSFHILKLESGAQTIVLSHPSDCVYYIAEGRGDVIDVERGEVQIVDTGSVIHIDRNDAYRLRANDGVGLVIFGGPCPPDKSLYVQTNDQSGA